jgi:hypothetical protein
LLCGLKDLNDMMKRRAEYSVGTIGDWKTRRLLLLGVLATSPACCGAFFCALARLASWQSSTLSLEASLSLTRVHFGTSIAKNRIIACSCSGMGVLTMTADGSRACTRTPIPSPIQREGKSRRAELLFLREPVFTVLCLLCGCVSDFLAFFLDITSSIDQHAEAILVVHRTFNKCPKLFGQLHNDATSKGKLNETRLMDETIENHRSCYSGRGHHSSHNRRSRSRNAKQQFIPRLQTTRIPPRRHLQWNRFLRQFRFLRCSRSNEWLRSLRARGCSDATCA